MIIIKNDNSIELKNKIHAGLRENNRSKCKWLKENISADITKKDFIPMNFLAYDNEKLIGGAIGFVEYNWYYLDLLWIDEQYRRIGVGTNLIRIIEKFAMSKKLTGVRVETWDFQARGFYEKMGYKIFGKINNCPPGTICYFLNKYF